MADIYGILKRTGGVCAPGRVFFSTRCLEKVKQKNGSGRREWKRMKRKGEEGRTLSLFVHGNGPGIGMAEQLPYWKGGTKERKKERKATLHHFPHPLSYPTLSHPILPYPTLPHPILTPFTSLTAIPTQTRKLGLLSKQAFFDSWFCRLLSCFFLTRARRIGLGLVGGEFGSFWGECCF